MWITRKYLKPQKLYHKKLLTVWLYMKLIALILSCKDIAMMRDYLAQTIGNGGSHAHGVHPTEDVEHTSTEVEGRSRHQNNSKTVT